MCVWITYSIFSRTKRSVIHLWCIYNKYKDFCFVPCHLKNSGIRVSRTCILHSTPNTLYVWSTSRCVLQDTRHGFSVRYSITSRILHRIMMIVWNPFCSHFRWVYGTRVFLHRTMCSHIRLKAYTVSLFLKTSTHNVSISVLVCSRVTIVRIPCS